MRTQFWAVVALATTLASSSFGATVYQNTTTDTLFTYFYSGGYTDIGDTVTLGGTDRVLTDATVQFYNAATAATFSAILSFWQVGTPVGAQIGSSYTVNGLSLASGASQNVTFSNLNLLVPNNLVVAVAVSNVSSGADLGLNAFTAPSPGSSNDQAIIVRSSGTFATGPTDTGLGNLYLRLNAVTVVPEPTALTLVGATALLLALARRSRG